ncbi:MAG: TonB-dependent receptor [Blastocatellia bacterium]|nr:TonB-dependent receptor [Blastocatellia bacterium]
MSKEATGRRSIRLFSIIMSALVIWFAAAPGAMTVSAQIEQARIGGVVYDQSGALVAGADVVARNERTGETRRVVTGQAGRFLVSNLKPSIYTVTATASGYNRIEYSRLELVVGQSLDLKIELKPVGTTEILVVVESSETALDNSSARLGANVNEREVAGLPLNGRQLSQLYLQAPGALNSGTGTFGDIRFSGRAVQQNIIRFDGVEGSAVIDASPGNLNGEIATPFRLQSSLENVQEFRVDSNSYPAEYGTGTGGQISVVTRSGSNRYHGSVFEYLRNDALDARNAFDIIAKAPLKLNQFGGSVGGPLRQDRFFFFASYEGYRLRSGINIIELAPSAAACASAVPAVQPLCPAAFRGPGSVTIGTSGQFDVLQLQASNPVDENSGSLRLDYKVNNDNSIYFRYFRDQGENSQPQNVTGSQAVINATPQNGVIAWQSTINQNKINELKVGYNSAYTRIFGVAPVVNGIDLSAMTINITGGVANTSIAGQGTTSGITVPGGLVRANSATNGRSQPYTPYTIALIDNLSLLQGSHSMKFGGEVRFLRLYTDRLGGTTYSYSNLNAFLANTPATVQYAGDLSAPSPFNNGITGERLAKQEFYIGYGQDEWKIRRNLTLNYGLRYEYYSPMREERDRQVVFDPAKGAILPSSSTPYKELKTNFAPRLGGAWSPFPSRHGFLGGGKTIVRAGFGINYGPGQTEDLIQPIESDRILVNQSAPEAQAFPADIQQIVSGFTNNPNNRQYSPRAYYYDRYQVPERIYSYSVSVQQELPARLTLTAAYVGSQGRNLFLRSIANRIVSVQTNPDPTQPAIVRREFDIVQADGSILKPFGEVDVKLSGGHDSYNSLQMALARRFSSGVILNAQYTFSRSYGNTAGSNEALTVGNNAGPIGDFDYDNGYNNFDVRHIFNISALYELPFGRKGSPMRKQLTGGWSIGTIANVRSGLPIDMRIVRPDILYGDASGNYFTAPAADRVAVINTPGGGETRGVRRPDLVPGVDPFINNNGNIMLNPAAFAIPQPGTFGNLMRNQLHGPGFSQVDLNLAKTTRILEHIDLRLAVEFFNLFNKANFANPNATLPNPFSAYTASAIQPGQAYTSDAAGANFGLLTRTVSRDVGLGSNRQIQFALRLIF